jgi:ammonium transporter, Amt family
MAIIGGIIIALVVGRNDPGFVHNGALAGLPALCAGSDLFHPIGALIVGGAGGFTGARRRSGLTMCLASSHCTGFGPVGRNFGWYLRADCTRWHQWSIIWCAADWQHRWCRLCRARWFYLYKVLNALMGLRVIEQEEMQAADLSIHKIGVNPESEIRGMSFLTKQ